MPPIFVTATPDPFIEEAEMAVIEQQQEDAYDHVRRPVRGIQLRGDTYSTLQVRTNEGELLKLYDAAGKEDADGIGRSTSYSNYLLQSVEEAREEKAQILETFSMAYIFFFGERPRFLQCRGVLLNTEDFNWRNEFLANYEEYLRGTKCVEHNARVFLSWDDIVVQGYILRANVSESAEANTSVLFEFQMFLTGYHPITQVGDSDAYPGGLIRPAVEWEEAPEGAGISPQELLDIRQHNISLAMEQANVSVADLLRNGQIFDAIGMVQAKYTEWRNTNPIAQALQKLKDYIGNRTIRVPVGFTGGIVYSEETGISATQLPAGTKISGAYVEVTAPLQRRMLKERRTGKLSDNEDEFVARGNIRITAKQSRALFGNILKQQRLKEDQQMETLKRIYQKMGFDLEPPSQMSRLFARVGFAMFNLTLAALQGRFGASPPDQSYTQATMPSSTLARRNYSADGLLDPSMPISTVNSSQGLDLIDPTMPAEGSLLNTRPQQTPQQRSRAERRDRFGRSTAQANSWTLRPGEPVPTDVGI